MSLCATCCVVPSLWCPACVCCPCYVCYQRDVILEGDWTRYRCCQNYCGHCGEDCECVTSKCPQCCMVVECLCCPCLALSSNRRFIQDKWMLSNTFLEKVMTCCLFGYECLFCLLRPWPLWNTSATEWVVDPLYLLFAPCLLAQQQNEWNIRFDDSLRSETYFL